MYIAAILIAFSFLTASPARKFAPLIPSSEYLAIDYRWADNQVERLPALVAHLVRQRVK
jgi:hypothetical protein